MFCSVCRMWNRFFAAGVYRVRPLADRREMTFLQQQSKEKAAVLWHWQERMHDWVWERYLISDKGKETDRTKINWIKSAGRDTATCFNQSGFTDSDDG